MARRQPAKRVTRHVTAAATAAYLGRVGDGFAVVVLVLDGRLAGFVRPQPVGVVATPMKVRVRPHP